MKAKQLVKEHWP